MKDSERVFKYYVDPGHGWLAVKMSVLLTLRIAHLISPYSYRKGQTAYLEEDCDMNLFFKTFEKEYGKKPEYVTVHHDTAKWNGSRYVSKDSPIRSYSHYYYV